MEIKIGNNITLGGNSPYQITPGLSGLGTPDIRTGDGLYAGVDGGYVSSQLYGFREIVIPGFYIAATCKETDDIRRNLISSLSIRYLFPIFIKTFGGRYYYTEGYITDIKADIEGVKANEFQITIVCPDPVIYDGGDGKNSDSAWMEHTFYKERPGGFDMEYTTPVQWTSGDKNLLIDNKGTIDTLPIIVMKGTYHNPTIMNLSTGKFVTLNRTITDETTLTIDMKKRIITLTDSDGNVSSIAPSRSTDSSWWSLIPGKNRIMLTTEDDEDTDYGIIKYKQGYQGV